MNSAHPFENPTPLSNFVEMLALLLIPAALCFTFGRLVNDTRQGWARPRRDVRHLRAARSSLCVASGAGTATRALAGLGVDQAGERRSRPAATWKARRRASASPSSALWATATTAASNGSVNAMHDSFTPLGGLVPLWLMQLGEIVFGGVGSGLYGMLMFADRRRVRRRADGRAHARVSRQEDRGLRDEDGLARRSSSRPPRCSLGTAIACVTERGTEAGIVNPGAHGFSEVLYAFSSGREQQRHAPSAASRANTPVLQHRSSASAMFCGALLRSSSPCSRSRARSPRRRLVPDRRHAADAHARCSSRMLDGRRRRSSARSRSFRRSRSARSSSTWGCATTMNLHAPRVEDALHRPPAVTDSLRLPEPRARRGGESRHRPRRL